MSAAQNSRRQYAYVAETTFGTTPTTPSMNLIEVVDFGLEVASQQLSDPSIRADRQESYARRGNEGVEGEMPVVLCPDNYDVFLEALLGGTWASNVVKCGTTARSFTFEEGFMDLSKYRTFNGVVVNSMSLEINTDNLVQASFGMMGLGSSALSGTSLDASPTPIVSQQKFFHEGGTISVGGSSVAYVTAIQLDFTNNFQGTYALGSTSYRALTPGRIQVTGTLTALFEDETLYNLFKNNTASSLAITLIDGAGSSHQYKMSNIRFTEGGFERGEDGPIFTTLTFKAIYDATDSTFMVTRV